jgi:serine/threonine protein kinase
VIHGDLNNRNVFVEYTCREAVQFRAKLLDFGLSRTRTKNAAKLGGTFPWTPPEIFTNGRAATRPAVDVYCFGLLIYFVTVGNHPYFQIPPEDCRRQLRAGEVPALLWPATGMAAHWRELAELCSQRSVADRPTIDGAPRLMLLMTDDTKTDQRHVDLHQSLNVARSHITQTRNERPAPASGWSASTQTLAFEDMCAKGFNQIANVDVEALGASFDVQQVDSSDDLCHL